MVAARDAAGLHTTNMAWNMVVGVLWLFRRRMTINQALRFADAIPPVVRALFLEHWHPGEEGNPSHSAQDMLAEVRSLRHEHNFSPDHAIEAVGSALRQVLPEDAFQRALAALPPQLRACWDEDSAAGAG